MYFKTLQWKEKYYISGPNFAAKVAMFHCFATKLNYQIRKIISKQKWHTKGQITRVIYCSFGESNLELSNVVTLYTCCIHCIPHVLLNLLTFVARL
jgi:hypothetical protein